MLTYGQLNYPNIKIGNCNYTIAEVGCFLTAFCNLEARYGKQIDPPTLNQLFKDKSIYKNYCDLYWGAISKFDPRFSTTDAGTGIPPHNDCIVEFVYGSGQTHFCLVDSVANHTIVDSLDGKIKKWDYYGSPKAWASYNEIGAIMSKYSDFKNSILGTIVGDGQCVSLIVNNSRAYVEQLFPGVSWPNIISPVTGAKDMAGKSNGYLQWIANDKNDPNQLPSQGDIMVFGATPSPGSTNTYPNPYGHTGVCESADSGGFNLLQENAPAPGQVANVTHYPWNFRPCLGWLHPLNVPAPGPTPAPPGKTITLPASSGQWHLYKVGGPYNPYDANSYKGILRPDLYGGLTYPIDVNRGNGIYTITSHDFGQGDLWTNGDYVIIK